MIRISILAVAVLATVLIPVLAEDGPAGDGKKAGLEVGKAGPAFELTASDGSIVSFKGLLEAEGTKAVIVEVAGANCPFTRTAEKAVGELVSNHGEHGLRMVAIFPNGADTPRAVQQYGSLMGAKHQLVQDPAGTVSTALGAEVTPTFFVFDTTGTLRYRGAVAELNAAVEAVMAGGTVEKTSAPVVGCAIRPAPKESLEMPEGIKLPPLSPEAVTWIGELLSRLGTEDPAVARSVIHGLQAIGPSALPHLIRYREGKSGPAAQRCDRIIRELRNPSDPSARDGRRAVTRLTMLQMQLRALENLIDLNPEQRKKLRAGFLELRDEEDRLRADVQAGRREGAAERRKALVEKSQVIVKSILTEKQWAHWQKMRRTQPAAGDGR